MSESYPRQHARTRRFTLGAPRGFQVSADGSRVAFLRSLAGDDPVNRLWVHDVATGAERIVADPAVLLGDTGDEQLTDAERARRERAREVGGGIVSYAPLPSLEQAVFALGGRVFRVDIGSDPDGSGDSVTELPTAEGAFDPQLSPDGQRVAYVAGATLRVLDAKGDRLLAGDKHRPMVSWGSAEFVAAEEMGRTRGFWWGPDSTRLLAARVDVSPVEVWHISSPEDPAAAPTPIRYPAAGTANAQVGLSVLSTVGATEVKLLWNRQRFEYVARAEWAPRQHPTLVVQRRDQHTMLTLQANPSAGTTQRLDRRADTHWVPLVPGSPAWLGDRPVTVEDRGPARSLFVDGWAVTPDHLQVLEVIAADDTGVVFAATDDPTQRHVWRYHPDGQLEQLTHEPGVHHATAGGDTLVVSSSSMEHPGVRTTVVSPHGRRSIESLAETPVLTPSVTFAVTGERELRSAVCYPTGDDGQSPLPVLLDPYGGPHALRVQRAQAAFGQSQWFADQGFAVVVTDGRGTPARGPAWERAVAGDLAGPVLDDQVAALEALADEHPRLDLSRVAIRGWSFGGYLAALAVLDRPDVFHAAIAGAPVTDWRLYDTHYTERYLGHPDEHPEAYQRTSLVARAERLARPLLLICGLADDNVVAAHTLQLSQALLAAGRPHQVLPLPGVTHMTPQEEVAENLLLLQRAFLFDSLGLSE